MDVTHTQSDPPVLELDVLQTTTPARYVAPESPRCTIEDLPAETLEQIAWYLYPCVASRFVACPSDEFPEATVEPWRQTCKDFRLVSRRYSRVETVLRGLFYNLTLYTTRESIERAFRISSHPQMARSVRCMTFRKPLLSRIFQGHGELFEQSSPTIGSSRAEIFQDYRRQLDFDYNQRCNRASRWSLSEVIRGMQTFDEALDEQDKFFRVANLPEQWKKLFSRFKRVNTIVLTGLELESQEGPQTNPVTRNAAVYRKLYPGILIYEQVRPIEEQSITSYNLDFESDVFKAIRESTHLNIQAIVVGLGFALTEYFHPDDRMQDTHYSPILQLPRSLASNLTHLDLELERTCDHYLWHDWNRRIYPLLKQCTGLESLALSGCRPDDYYDQTGVRLNILSNIHTLYFPKLRELAFERFAFDASEFRKFILDHRDTLRYVTLKWFAPYLFPGWAEIMLPLLKSICETACLTLSDLVRDQPSSPGCLIHFSSAYELREEPDDPWDSDLWDWLQSRGEWTDELNTMWT